MTRFLSSRLFTSQDLWKKDNRLIALSAPNKARGRYTRVDALQLQDKQTVRGWLKGFENEVLIGRQIFTNKDGSTGVLNLVSSDTALDGEQMTTLYKSAGAWKFFTNHANPMRRWLNLQHARLKNKTTMCSCQSMRSISSIVLNSSYI